MFFSSNTHPYNNTNNFKAIIFKHTMPEIFVGFIIAYLLMAIAFSFAYLTILSNDNLTYMKILEFSTFTSFLFDTDFKEGTSDLFIWLHLIHNIIALVLSTIFTAAIVLKFFYLPQFFVFKKKCNFVPSCEENGEKNILTVSFYNSIDLFVTDCKVRIYGRVESIDENNTKSLININNNQPIFEKTYPFMEQHLATRLRVEFNKDDFLYEWLVNRKVENKKLAMIIILEANAARLDRTIYEVHDYSLNAMDIEESVDFHGHSSIDLNYDNYSLSGGWKEFED